MTRPTPGIAIRPATRQQSKLRLAIFGPSGSGKTMTALRLATGLTRVIPGKIGLIDSELGSSELYADRWPFDVAHVPDHSTDAYIAHINAFAKAGYDVLIIDSLSHPWEWLKEWVDTLAQAKYRGNTWAAWNEGTPKQRALIDAILTYPGHIIATMRSKTEWSIDKENSNKPTRVGLAPQQRPGSEYEWTLLFELSVAHTLTCIKDRSGRFQDLMVTKPDETLGEDVARWLQEGGDPIPMPEVTLDVSPPAASEMLARIAERLIAGGLTREYAGRRLPFIGWLLQRAVTTITDVTMNEAEALLRRLADPERVVMLLDEWRLSMSHEAEAVKAVPAEEHFPTDGPAPEPEAEAEAAKPARRTGKGKAATTSRSRKAKAAEA